MMSQLTRILLSSLCISVALMSATPAFAAKKKQSHHKVRKSKAEGSSLDPSAERVARLKRECRGRPNAGACEGYTR